MKIVLALLLFCIAANGAAHDTQEIGKPKPTINWVGVYPHYSKTLYNLYKEFGSDVNHKWWKKEEDNGVNRIVIIGGDGISYFINPNNVNEDTAEEIREKWRIKK